jgi:serine protease inhibitor
MRITICAALSLVMLTRLMGQPSNDCTQDVIGNSNALAFWFLESTYNTTSNVALSPVSIATVNAMLTYGGAGSTRDELLRLQKKPVDISCLNTGIKNFVELAPSNGDSVQFDIVNAAWFNNAVHVKPDFTSFLDKNLKANIFNVDFNHDPSVTDMINQFFSEKTHGKITSIFEEPLPIGTEWVVGNACYFKGDWKIPFKVTNTKVKTFMTAAGKPVSASFMTSELMYRYNVGPNFKLLAIPYVGDRFSFVICMPDHNGSVSQLMQTMDEETFFSVLSTAGKTTVLLQLPKFTLREKYDLVNVYEHWGISAPFTVDADFTNIWEGSSPIREFWHGIFIQVDEKGTEAAAVTAAASFRSMPDSFIADKPFFFAIVDEINKVILFAGIINDPSLSKP